MTHSDAKQYSIDIYYFTKIRQRCCDLLSFVDNVSFEQYSHNLEKQLAIGMCFVNFSDYADKLIHSNPLIMQKYPSIPWKKIRNFKNVLTHNYDTIDLESTWNTIQNDIPDLIDNLSKIINDDQSQEATLKACSAQS